MGSLGVRPRRFLWVVLAGRQKRLLTQLREQPWQEVPENYWRKRNVSCGAKTFYR